MGTLLSTVRASAVSEFGRYVPKAALLNSIPILSPEGIRLFGDEKGKHRALEQPTPQTRLGFHSANSFAALMTDPLTSIAASETGSPEDSLRASVDSPAPSSLDSSLGMGIAVITPPCQEEHTALYSLLQAIPQVDDWGQLQDLYVNTIAFAQAQEIPRWDAPWGRLEA